MLTNNSKTDTVLHLCKGKRQEKTFKIEKQEIEKQYKNLRTSQCCNCCNKYLSQTGYGIGPRESRAEQNADSV